MIRRPPRPTLLPNATLFRSASDELAAALGQGINARAEPMVSHDVVAFDLLSERVSQSIRVVQSGQGADEVFAGYHWYPPLQGVDRQRAVETYARAFFDRDAADMAELVSDRYAVDGDPSREFVQIGRASCRERV